MEKLSDRIMNMPVIPRASIVARRAHEDQTRKYTGEPYFNHCRAVAMLVSQRGGTNWMIAAAYLHDTIEDTMVTAQWLRVYFPPAVVDIVVGLTDVYTTQAYPSLNRQQRKRLEVERYALEAADVQRVKLCDLMDNTRSIIEHDPKFAITYLKEKADLMAVFREEVMK